MLSAKDIDSWIAAEDAAAEAEDAAEAAAEAEAEAEAVAASPTYAQRSAPAQRLPPPPGPSLLERVDDDTAVLPLVAVGAGPRAAHGACGDLGLHHWSEDVSDGGRRCVASRRRRPDPHGARRERGRRAGVVAPHATASRVAGAAERLEARRRRRVSDSTGARGRCATARAPWEHAAATAALVAAGPPRPAPVATTPGSGRGRRLDGRAPGHGRGARPVEERRSLSTWKPTRSFRLRASRACCRSRRTARTTSSIVSRCGRRSGRRARVFADPAVRKVFHSCEGVDIPRLDRDFGIRVVNCADTQIAAAALELPLGLVDLLGACAIVDGRVGRARRGPETTVPEL